VIQYGREALWTTGASASFMGEKSRGPGLSLPEVTAAATTSPDSPPAAVIAYKVLDLSLNLARKK
jgi:hypothetical protein